MEISIIIPALNESACIVKAVERAWLTQPVEVIVVDGGSEDDTFGSARAAGARAIASSPGRAIQQNLGARHARGEVLLFLHADTWLADDALAQITAALDDPAIIHGAFRQRIESSAVLYRWLERGNAFRVRWCALPYGDQGIFVRREVFEAVGGFPEVAFMEDWLLMRQMRKLGRPVLLPGPLYVSARRWQKHGVIRQTIRNWALIAAASLGVSPQRLARFYSLHSQS